MELNRQIIKNQAKSLIKGKVIPLFLVCAVVSFLTSASSIFSTSFEFDKDDGRFSFSQGYDFGDPFGSFDIDEFESDNENDSDDAQWDSGFFDDFAGNITVKNMSLSSSDVLHKMIRSALTSVFSIVSTVFFALFIPFTASLTSTPSESDIAIAVREFLTEKIPGILKTTSYFSPS